MSVVFFRAAALAAVATSAACSAGTTGTRASLAAPADSAVGYSAPSADTTAPAASDSAGTSESSAARLARHVGFRQAMGDATRLGIVTGYTEVRPGRMALMLGPGFSAASTVEYHLKRIYSAYGDYLNHNLAPVIELRDGSEIVGDYTWDGLALTGKAGKGS
jgi:hypothetical protein